MANTRQTSSLHVAPLIVPTRGGEGNGTETGGRNQKMPYGQDKKATEAGLQIRLPLACFSGTWAYLSSNQTARVDKDVLLDCEAHGEKSQRNGY